MSSEAQASIDRRLNSIAKANDILHAQSGNAALLSDIVDEALAGCGVGSDRVSRAGPDVCIDSSMTIMVSLAIHELCTNAFKYGALSTADGKVEIHWELDADDDFRGSISNGPSAAGRRLLRPTARGSECAS